MKNLVEIKVKSISRNPLVEPKVELRIKTRAKTHVYQLKTDDVVEIV